MVVTGPDSEPSIKVKEEVLRLGLTYQLKQRGPQKLSQLESGTRMGFYNVRIVCECVCVCNCLLFNTRAASVENGENFDFFCLKPAVF